MKLFWKVIWVAVFNIGAGVGMVLLALNHAKLALWLAVAYFLLISLLDMLKDILKIVAGEEVYYIRFWKRFESLR